MSQALENEVQFPPYETNVSDYAGTQSAGAHDRLTQITWYAALSPTTSGSEPVSLSCKGITKPCCNTLAPEKFCRQCVVLCAMAPDAGNIIQRLLTKPIELASRLPNQITQQYAGLLLLNQNIQLVECDSKASSFFASTEVFQLAASNIYCSNARIHEKFVAGVHAVLMSGTPRHVLLYADTKPQQRYCLILFPVSVDSSGKPLDYRQILAVIHPLDGRRVATAKQLMELFGLSAAEARLTRALARGESIDYYAAEQGIKTTTARCQLRSAFAKTGVDRQAELVRLAIGVPPIR